MHSPMLAFLVLSLSSVASLAACNNVFDSLHSVPRGWSFFNAAESDTHIKLRVSLKQQNLGVFHDKLMEVSTPNNPNYGNHYEGHELRSLLKPTDETTKVVIAWLQDHNITSLDNDDDYILFRTEVESANKLLNTTFAWYRHEETNEHLLRTLSYDVPADVAKHIDFVQPTTRFGGIKPMISLSRILDDGQKSDGQSKWVEKILATAAGNISASCNLTITPQCLQDLYNTRGYVADDKCGNTVGYASFLEQYARYKDLTQFEKVYTPWSTGANFSVIQFNGGLNDQDSDEDSGEANLDQQYLFGMSYPTPITEFSTAGRGLLIPDGDSPTQADNTNEPYLEFLIALLKLENWQIPNSISISYGENEQEIPREYAVKVCQMFGQLGARGKSIIVSSGDSGVGDWCLSNDGKNTTKFPPQFPASCPYVTSVGGTRYIKPETAVYFSSGGFSDYWSTPWYQRDTIDAYKNQIGNKNAGYFNANGRAFPDVAAQSHNFRVIDKGFDKGYLGTSCSAPVFNGIVALLNSERIKNYTPPLGFLNPWIYSEGYKGFNDITTGVSTGCDGFSRFHGRLNGGPVVPGASWDAIPGWDAVTGFGTPDFAKLVKMMPDYRPYRH